VSARFRQEMSDGTFKFVREGTDLELHISEPEFEAMRSDGRADQFPTKRRGDGAPPRLKISIPRR
jgi:hypothetical protein